MTLSCTQCDGVLCDGASPENAASTVVDCRRIDEGDLGFFRIGIMPKSKVLELFEEVREENPPVVRPEPWQLTSSADEETISGPASPDVIPEHDLITIMANACEKLVQNSTSPSEGFDNPVFSECNGTK